MIIRVDVELSDRGLTASDGRPDEGTPVVVELRDTTALDTDSIRLASRTTMVQGSASAWLATTELVVDDVDPTADLTVWVRIAASGNDDLSAGDWITMQSVRVDPASPEQRVTAPVSRVG